MADEKRPRPSLGPTVTTLVTGPPPLSRRERAILTVLFGAEPGRVFSVPQGLIVTIGRAPDCIFALPDPSVSLLHAHLVHAAGSYALRDAGSTNGTFVNDVRLAESVDLKDGDRVRLGPSTVLRFSVVDVQEEEALKQVYRAAIYDAVTGIYNRKHVEERLDSEVKFAVRHGAELVFVLFDVDHFKKVNDTHGHLAGDLVLRGVASVLARALRAEDVIGRWGGEEFAVIARGISVENAMKLADRLRQKVEAASFDFEGTPLRVTVSAGVAGLGECGEKKERTVVVGLADARLYEAKDAGRNRVLGPPPPGGTRP